MGVTWSQMFPPTPSLTESNLQDQRDKVFIVTGGYSGIGEALAAILYRAGGLVYIAGRSEQKAKEAITRIQSQQTAVAANVGKLEFLPVDLSDLASIKPAAELFRTKESRLDVLFNNAAVSLIPAGQTTAQGHELTMGTNCLGPLLLTLELLPLLKETAAKSPASSVRVVWSSSQVVDFSATGGMLRSDWLTPPSQGAKRYEISKTGNWFLASELARRYAKDQQILSLTQNPGPLQTNLLRNGHWILPWLVRPLLYPALNGAYTELYSGLSPDLHLENHSGAYVLPWGRVHSMPRQDLLDALKLQDEGGTGRAAEFWDWCDEQIAPYR